jgi:uridine kinase
MQKDKIVRNVKLIGIGGGTCSGKTAIAKKIYKTLLKSGKRTIILSLDYFYKGLPVGVDPLKYDFDCPDAFDLDCIISTLNSLKERKTTYIPAYDYVTHKQIKDANLLPEADIIIFEGILTLHFKQLLDLMDFKIYVDTAPDIRLSRRIRRDIKERGRDVEGILTQWETSVRDSHDKYIQPTYKSADLIITVGKENHTGISLAVDKIENL